MIEKIIARILTKKKLTLALAESCTGGLVADSLTNIPGSSKYFTLGIVAYSNEAKKRLLNVPGEVLSQHGAVSKETALLLAKNVKLLGQADIGIGITGIAGPSGATSSKPVGIVFIAVSLGHRNYFKKFNFTGTRIKIKRLAKDAALALLLECLS
jgi:nicotinamide-nucleotide amidase